MSVWETVALLLVLWLALSVLIAFGMGRAVQIAERRRTRPVRGRHREVVRR